MDLARSQQFQLKLWYWKHTVQLDDFIMNIIQHTTIRTCVFNAYHIWQVDLPSFLEGKSKEHFLLEPRTLHLFHRDLDDKDLLMLSMKWWKYTIRLWKYDYSHPSTNNLLQNASGNAPRCIAFIITMLRHLEQKDYTVSPINAFHKFLYSNIL